MEDEILHELHDNNIYGVISRRLKNCLLDFLNEWVSKGGDTGYTQVYESHSRMFQGYIPGRKYKREREFFFDL